MFVQTETTPNPNSLKFLPGKTVSNGGSFEIFKKDDVKNELIRNLMSVNGVEGIFLSKDFISINKYEDTSWDEIKHIAISLINDPTLISLMMPLKIDAHLNPRATTVSSILRHVRHGRVNQVYSIGDAEGEVIEAKILSTSPMSGQAIKDIGFPEGAVIGAIKRGEEFIKPSGDSKIFDGDIVVIFSISKDVPEVEKLLQVTINLF